ncbi:putative G protein [Maize associated rhabdovirus]|uniref:Putative G protein n=1 Tax=Maize associated rhabdovirus TaxID=2003308 RepID=A0A1X9Y2V3_9RHAB|nr:putative G protein [Maize associated rhabdovirus]ARS22494.1 putative G protein [Maize associated rhabdovirus]
MHKDKAMAFRKFPFTLLILCLWTKSCICFSTLSCRSDSQPTITQCLESCEDLKDGPSVSVTFYRQEISNVITIAKCRWVTVEQSFTETWTFSRLKSEPVTTYLEASPDECRDALSNVCHNIPGCVSKARSPIPEYSWARTEAKRVKYLYIETFNTSGLIEPDRKYVFVDGKVVEMSLSHLVSSGFTHVWNPISSGTACPWQVPESTFVCNWYGDDNIICPKEGLYLEGIVSLTFSCTPNRMVDKGGLIFSISKNPQSDWYPEVIETADVGIKEAIASVKYSLKIHEQTECQSRCISVQTTPTLVNGRYYIPNKNISCSIVSNCTVDLTTFTCNNGELLWAHCSGKRHWINMKTAMIEITPRCSPMSRSKISRAEVLDILNVYHGIHRIPELLRGDVISSLLITPEDSVNHISVVDGEGEEINLPNEEGSIISEFATKIFLYIQALEHNIKVVIATVICLIIGYVIVNSLKGIMSSRKYKQVPIQMI